MTANVNETPGEVQARRLEIACAQLVTLLSQPENAGRLRAHEGETEWSAMQVLGHVTEMIPYWLGQCQMLILAGIPPLFGRTPDAPERLAGPERGATAEVGALLGVLNEEVQAAARIIRGMTPAERDKRGRHVRRGEMRVEDVVELHVVAHVEEHLAQVRVTLGV